MTSDDDKPSGEAHQMGWGRESKPPRWTNPPREFYEFMKRLAGTGAPTPAALVPGTPEWEAALKAESDKTE